MFSMATRDIVSILLPAIPLALWAFLLFPLLLRLFGMNMPLSLRKRWRMRTSFGQRFFSGALGYSVGMIIFAISSDSIGWRMYQTPMKVLTASGFLHVVFTWTFGGIVFGLLMASVGSEKATE